MSAAFDRKSVRPFLAAGILLFGALSALAGPLDLPGMGAGEPDLDAFFDGSKKLHKELPVVVPTPQQTPTPQLPASPLTFTVVITSRTFPADEAEKQKWLHDLLNPKDPPAPRYLLGDQMGPAAMGMMRPAYGLFEGVSDGVYNLLRGHLFGYLLPGGLRRGLGAPKGNSYEVFNRKFNEKELRFLDRLCDTYPGHTKGYSAADSYDQSAVMEWRKWAAQEQVSVLIDAGKDTLIERYRFARFGDRAKKYADDKRNWKDPQFIAVAGTVGAAFLYFNGLHTDFNVMEVKVGLDLQPAQRLRNALEGGGRLDRAAGVEIGYADKPITFSADFGIDSGQLQNRVYGVRYRTAF